MRAFWRKRWFLLLLTAGLLLAFGRPEWLSPYTRRLPPLAVVAPALFLVALGLESRSLWQALTRPLPALWAVLISYGAVPALGWLAGGLLPDPGLRIGLMIVTSVPCTLASAVLWTRLAGGSEGTALCVTLLTTATSWLATTTWLWVTTGTQVQLDPAGLMGELFLILVVPVALGQVLRTVRPVARAAGRHRAGLGVVSQLLILAIILKAAVDFRTRLEAQTVPLGGAVMLTGILCVGIHLAALAGGLRSSRGLGFDRPTQIAVAFACSQKTLPVALFLFEAHFAGAPLAVVPLVFYHGGQLVVDTFIAERFVSSRKQEPGVPAGTVI